MLSKKKVRDAIKDSFGIMNVIAKRCGVNRITIWYFLQKEENQEFHKLIEQEKEKIIDVAENQCVFQAAKGNMDAIKILLLKHKRGRMRGYDDRIEISQFNANEIKVVFEEGTNDRNDLIDQTPPMKIIDVEKKEIKDEDDEISDGKPIF